MNKEFSANRLFDIQKTLSHDKSALKSGNSYDYITRTVLNRGICDTTGFIDSDSLNEAGTFSLELMNLTFFYRERPWYAGQFIRKIVPRTKEICNQWLYFEVMFSGLQKLLKSVLVRDVDKTFNNFYFQLPIQTDKNGYPMIDSTYTYHDRGYIPDWDYMDKRIQEIKERRICDLEAQRIRELKAYLAVTGLENLSEQFGLNR